MLMLDDYGPTYAQLTLRVRFAWFGPLDIKVRDSVLASILTHYKIAFGVPCGIDTMKLRLLARAIALRSVFYRLLST